MSSILLRSCNVSITFDLTSGSCGFSSFYGVCAAVAQLVERVLGKDEVMGSSPISSSWLRAK
jgi:hypothetical protein